MAAQYAAGNCKSNQVYININGKRTKSHKTKTN